MAYQPIFIGPQNTGLERDFDAIYLPDDAYPELRDMFIFRGRLKRKRGYNLLGRLKRCFDDVILSIQANGAIYSIADLLADPSINVRASDPLGTIDPGSLEITVGLLVFSDDGMGGLSAGGGNTGTINYTSGALTLNFDPPLGAPTNVVVDLCYFPNRSVMGLKSRELTQINREQLIAFDTRYAYRYSTTMGTFEELPSTPAKTWTGGNADFFWTTNFLFATDGSSIFWAVNYVSADGISYYDASVPQWVTINPITNTAGDTLNSCLILLPYKGRLIALNTRETIGATPTNKVNHVRFSEIGNPRDATNGWRDDVPGRGGFIDLPTNEAIITAFFYYDTLIIGCERSLWQLRSTGNPILPFTPQRISSEYGAESTFSFVPFDEGVLMVGNRAIISGNSSTARRIDTRIPDEVFNFHNANNGPERVHGIRDYRNELVYWTFPNDDENKTFPNRILLYNYQNGSYAFLKESFTTFGNFERFDDRTWKMMTIPWLAANFTWNDPSLQSGYPAICAGNQQGFVVEFVESTQTSITRYISAVTTGAVTTITSPNHNFDGGEWILITGVVGVNINNSTTPYFVEVVNSNDFIIKSFDPSGAYPDVPSTGTYGGGGVIREIPNFDVRTKRFSPFMAQSRGISVDYLDMFLVATDKGEFSLEVIPNQRDSDGRILTVPTSLQTTAIPPSTMGFQDKYWTRVYVNSNAQFLQYRYFISDAQMQDPAIREAEVELHAMIIHAKPAMRIIG